jgi:twitching motility two-component system response regulator PilH
MSYRDTKACRNNRHRLKESKPKESVMARSVLSRLFAGDHLQHSASGAALPAASKPATVLVVDDSRTMVHALRLILERAGYHTLSAADGVEAVDTVRRRRPDLVLMDIVMPNMNGFEATRILNRDAATAAIPIVIVSGSGQPTDYLWGARQGAKGFLAKPIRKDLLLHTVAKVLRETRARQKPVAESMLNRASRTRRVLNVSAAC